MPTMRDGTGTPRLFLWRKYFKLSKTEPVISVVAARFFTHLDDTCSGLIGLHQESAAPRRALVSPRPSWAAKQRRLAGYPASE